MVLQVSSFKSIRRFFGSSVPVAISPYSRLELCCSPKSINY